MILFIVFVFGLIWGSFLNVLIYRLPRSQDVIKKSSYCPKCKKVLRFWEMIPILSFFIIGGRCLGCRVKISWQYPLVEFLSGLIWVLVFYKIFGSFRFEIWNFPAIGGSAFGGGFVSNFGFRISDFLYDVFILSSLLAVAAIDIKLMIIPDNIIYPVVIVIFLYRLLEVIRSGDASLYFIWPSLAASFLFLLFFSIFFFSKGRAMGFGDAKLGFLIGLFLGFAQMLIAFFWAFVIGASFGIILIVLRRKKFSSQTAFGPFLVLGAAIAYLLPYETFLSLIENLLVIIY